MTGNKCDGQHTDYRSPPNLDTFPALSAAPHQVSRWRNSEISATMLGHCGSYAFVALLTTRITPLAYQRQARPVATPSQHSTCRINRCLLVHITSTLHSSTMPSLSCDRDEWISQRRFSTWPRTQVTVFLCLTENISWIQPHVVKWQLEEMLDPQHRIWNWSFERITWLRTPYEPQSLHCFGSNSLTLQAAAVGTAWSLLGSHRSGQATLYVFLKTFSLKMYCKGRMYTMFEVKLQNCSHDQFEHIYTISKVK